MDSFDDKLVKLPHFDWDKAKNFYYVVKIGSQTDAAKFLNTSQSSLSRQISALEYELNCILISSNRSPKRRVQLTRKGEEFFSIIEESFLKLKGFTYNQTAMSRDGKKRKIRISTTHGIASYVIGKHLLEFNENNADIIFEVVAEDRFIDLNINDVDIAIRPYDTEAKGIHQEYLFTLEKKLFASPQYLKKYGEPRTIEDLKIHRFISHAQPEKHPYSDLAWILKLGMPEGQMHEPVFMSSSLENAIAAAEKGIGIVGSYEMLDIVKQSDLINILPNVTALPVKWFMAFPEYLIGEEKFENFKKWILEQY